MAAAYYKFLAALTPTSTAMLVAYDVDTGRLPGSAVREMPATPGALGEACRGDRSEDH